MKNDILWWSLVGCFVYCMICAFIAYGIGDNRIVWLYVTDALLSIMVMLAIDHKETEGTE
jgi:hypothetical protein